MIYVYGRLTAPLRQAGTFLQCLLQNTAGGMCPPAASGYFFTFSFTVLLYTFPMLLYTLQR